MGEWDDMFQRLVDYKNECKSTNVPYRYKADPQLANWVHNQRTRYSKKEISADRINRLKQIGFVWNSRDVEWDDMFQRLVDYKKKCKSANVPRSYEANPKLTNWINNQR